MKYVVLLLTFLVFPLSALHATEAQQKQAMELVDKAIEHYKKVGFDEAKKSFEDKNGAFVDGQWYVIIFTKEGIFKTHAHNQKLVDNPRLPALKDVNGRVILDEMVNAGVQTLMVAGLNISGVTLKQKNYQQNGLLCASMIITCSVLAITNNNFQSL